MSFKSERLLFIIALVICTIAAVFLYIIGVDGLAQPEQAEYVIKSLLYIAGLVAIRGLWKLTLDNKIRSKKERQNEH